MNIHQTSSHARFLESIGWKIESIRINHEVVHAFVRTLPLLPISLLKLQRVTLEQIDWSWVQKLERKHHVYETLIELDHLTESPQLIQLDDFIQAHDFMLTTKTRIVDLTHSDDLLLSDFKPKTRYNIRLAKKHRLTATIWSTAEVASNSFLFHSIYTLLTLNARRIRMLLLPSRWIKQQFESFGDSGFVIGIFDATKKMVNLAVFYCSSTTCSYSHNGSTASGRQQMGPTLAVWLGMLEAKRRGLSVFDFDGVYDERYGKLQHRFKGFGRFKEGFGGKELYFPPMFRRRRFPFK